MKKQDVFICTAIPAVTATALVLTSGGGTVLSALGAVCVALGGLIESLVLTLLPLAKLLIIPALGIVTARFIHAVGKDTGSAHPTLCAAVSGACAMLLFSYFPPLTGLLAIIMSAIVWGVYSENKTDEGAKWLVWILATVFGFLILVESGLARGELVRQMREQAGVAHRLSEEDLDAYDAWLRKEYMRPGVNELALREWAMGPGMTQSPISQGGGEMRLDMPGLPDNLTCYTDADGRVHIPDPADHHTHHGRLPAPPVLPADRQGLTSKNLP